MSDDDVIARRLALPTEVTPSDWPCPDPAEPDYAGTFAVTLRDVALVLVVVLGVGGVLVSLVSFLSGY